MAKIFSLNCKSVKFKVSEHYVYINEDMLSDLMMEKIKESSSSIETGKEYFADVQIQVKVYPSSITASEVVDDDGHGKTIITRNYGTLITEESPLVPGTTITTAPRQTYYRAGASTAVTSDRTMPCSEVLNSNVETEGQEINAK